MKSPTDPLVLTVVAKEQHIVLVYAKAILLDVQSAWKLVGPSKPEKA